MPLNLLPRLPLSHVFFNGVRVCVYVSMLRVKEAGPVCLHNYSGRGRGKAEVRVRLKWGQVRIRVRVSVR